MKFLANITRHTEHLPFGELLVDEHRNSHNTRYKFNGKEFDQETGNYYYGARSRRDLAFASLKRSKTLARPNHAQRREYYNPKTSLLALSTVEGWLSVDPLAEKYNEWSPYNYTLNNPVKYVDPDGREIVYHDNNSLLFNIGFKLRLTFLKIFGKREIRKNIKFLQKTRHKVIISNNKSTGLGSYTRPKTLTDYLKTEESVVPNVPSFIDDSQETINKYKRAKKNFDSNKPDLHKQKGIGDSSYMNFDFDTDLEQDVDYKDNKNTTIVHEIFHAVRIAKGLVKDRKTEEIKATQHVNKNMRNEKNRRQNYGEWEIPKK